MALMYLVSRHEAHTSILRVLSSTVMGVNMTSTVCAEITKGNPMEIKMNFKIFILADFMLLILITDFFWLGNPFLQQLGITFHLKTEQLAIAEIKTSPIFKNSSGQMVGN
jgi:hypothetical protein